MNIPCTSLNYWPGDNRIELIEGYGLVWDCKVVGINLVRDLFARLRDLIGGNTVSYEVVVKGTVETMLQTITQHAQEVGAHAVISLVISVRPFPAKNMSMVVVTVSGTPVRLTRAGPERDNREVSMSRTAAARV